MTVVLGPVVRIGEHVIAPLKTPLAILIGTGDGVTAVSVDGAPLTDDEVGQLCPTALARFAAAKS